MNFPLLAAVVPFFAVAAAAAIIPALEVGSAPAEVDPRQPVNAEVYRQADALYLDRHADGASARALAVLDKGLSSSPLDTGLLWRYGRARVVVGEQAAGGRGEHFLSAQQALQTALDVDGGSVDARYWMAVTLLRRSRFREALSHAHAALELSPEEGRIHHLIGQICWRAPRRDGGDRRRALAEFEKAVALAARRPAHYVSLAEAYSDLGRAQDAKAVLERLDSLAEPEDPADLVADDPRLRRLKASLRR